jgi:NAD-dependent dihydropyrimidine dehydrogenase PreA subunit
LLWEELANLEDTAWLSSCLLLVITGGAVVCSLLFEKRFWCRYLCPVGGMNGLMAKLSVLELRAEAGTCSGSCSSYACFKGGPAEGEGLATGGCPLGTHPAHLEDNRNCVLCLTCVQACPHRSVKLRLRPPAADLQKGMAVPFGERLLLLVLLGGVALHHWQGWLAWLPWAPESLQAGPLLPRFGVGLIALLLPVLVAGWWPKPLLYGLLPLVWALLLSRYLPLGMVEAGQLLPVSAFPWQGAAAALWPSWSADQHVVAFCQSAVIAVGLIWSLVILRRLLLTSPRLLGLGSTLAIALALGGRWLTGMA